MYEDLKQRVYEANMKLIKQSNPAKTVKVANR